MRFQCTDEEIKDTIGGVFTILHKDDIKTMKTPDEIAWGERACAAGWGIDLDGNVETGERKPGAAKIQPADVVQKIG